MPQLRRTLKSSSVIATFMETGWLDPEWMGPLGARYMSHPVPGFDDPDLGPTLVRLTVSGNTNTGQRCADILHLEKIKMPMWHGLF